MSRFLDVLGTIVLLELRQRIRSIAWLVLISVVFVLVAIVTVLLWFALPAFGDAGTASAGVYSTLIFFVLLVGTLVSPAMSGAAVNGDREAGTLATTQVTLVTSTQLVLGKFLAAWTVSLTFLAAALPAMVFTVVIGQVRLDTLVASLLVLVLQLGVVAALSIGTLIAFALGALALQTKFEQTYIGLDWSSDLEFDERTGEPIDPVCLEPTVYEQSVPRNDLVWGFLAANPYVVLADASPPQWDGHGNPVDLFGSIAVGVRYAQQPPVMQTVIDECAAARDRTDAWEYDRRTPREVYDESVPSWFVGLAVHVLVAVGLLAGAVARTRTPTGRLPRGSRVA